MDALIASYGDSSSGSDSEESSSSSASHSLPPLNSLPSLLPPPSISLLTAPNSLAGTHDFSQTGQPSRVRTFPHVEGNYAFHVFIPGTAGSLLSGKMTGDASAEELAREAQEAKDVVFAEQLRREKSKGKVPSKASEASKAIPQRIPPSGKDVSSQPWSGSKRSSKRIVLGLHSSKGLPTLGMKGVPPPKKKPALEGPPSPKVIHASMPTDASGSSLASGSRSSKWPFSISTPRREGPLKLVALDTPNQMKLVDEWVRTAGVTADPSPSLREAERAIMKAFMEMLRHTRGLADLDGLHKKLKSLKVGNISLREEVETLRGEKECLSTKLAAADQRIMDLESELALSRRRTTELESELAISQTTVEEVMLDLEGVRRDLTFLRSDRIPLCDRDDFWWSVIRHMIENEGIEFRPDFVREWVERVNDSWPSPRGDGYDQGKPDDGTAT